MVIQHSIPSVFTANQLYKSRLSSSKSMEKLSSGYQINRAADNAAGLSISEKMRWQVRGLDRSALNITDGISLVQVADGALNEATALLQRMRELSVQAANDTNTSMDRSAAQAEIDQSIQEFNRIAKTTSLNGVYPLNANDELAIDPQKEENHTPTQIQPGTFLMDTGGLEIDADGEKKSVTGFQFDLKSCTPDDLNGKTFFATCTQNCDQTFAFSFDKSIPLSGSTGKVKGDSLSVKIGLGGNPSMADVAAEIGNAIRKSSLYDERNDNAGNTFRIGHANNLTINGTALTFYPINGRANTSGSSYSTTINGKTYNNLNMSSVYLNGLEDKVTIKTVASKFGLNIQSGALENQAIQIPLYRMSADRVGIDPLNVSSFETAGAAIDSLDKAINWVNEKRSTFGAVQNRLEHAYSVNKNTSENTDAAESRIRDTDMAKEMVNFSRDNIINQAGEAMLSQIKTDMQSVLALLQ